MKPLASFQVLGGAAPRHRDEAQFAGRFMARSGRTSHGYHQPFVYLPGYGNAHGFGFGHAVLDCTPRFHATGILSAIAGFSQYGFGRMLPTSGCGDRLTWSGILPIIEEDGNALKKILVIEDEPLMRRNLVAALQSEGFTVVEAADGGQGIELARTETPDLIVCDVGMPGKDGYEVLQAVRADPAIRGIPFIFLTGKGERTDVRAGMNLGADDYLPKPVGREELLAAIRARLQRQVLSDHPPSAQTMEEGFAAACTTSEPLEALGLTKREAEVLLWVAQGKTNPEIGMILSIRHSTVKKHLERVFTKLGVETRTSASRMALETLMQQARR